ERHLVGVLEIAADREAAREPRDAHVLAKAVRQVSGGRLAGHRRVGREDDLDDAVFLYAREEVVDAEVGRLDAVERRKRAAEDVVEALVLAGPLDRDDVDRLLDHADHGTVAPRVSTDRTQLLLREVPALTAEADARLDVLDRLGEPESVLRSRRED